MRMKLEFGFNLILFLYIKKFYVCKIRDRNCVLKYIFEKLSSHNTCVCAASVILKIIIYSFFFPLISLGPPCFILANCRSE
jgi:hypothetical protein